MNICILSLSERGLSDDRLAQAMSAVPPHSIVLFEDIDAAFPSRDKISSNTRDITSVTNDITLSGLLNVLDGVASSEERLIFMTTNYIDRLDPALIRPGRVDLIQLIGDATAHQIKAMLTKFYPGADEILCDKFAAKMVNSKVSMAQLQGHFLRYKDDAQEALSNIRDILACRTKNTSDEQDHVKTLVDHDQRKREAAIARAKRGPVSALDVDRMVFNPQEGWDQNIKSL
jgi:chaperone BCS1